MLSWGTEKDQSYGFRYGSIQEHDRQDGRVVSPHIAALSVGFLFEQVVVNYSHQVF